MSDIEELNISGVLTRLELLQTLAKIARRGAMEVGISECASSFADGASAVYNFKDKVERAECEMEIERATVSFLAVKLERGGKTYFYSYLIKPEVVLEFDRNQVQMLMEENGYLLGSFSE